MYLRQSSPGVLVRLRVLAHRALYRGAAFWGLPGPRRTFGHGVHPLRTLWGGSPGPGAVGLSPCVSVRRSAGFSKRRAAPRLVGGEAR